MKTTFSYFPGMFENPVPAVKISFKLDINYKFQKYHELHPVIFREHSLLLIKR